MSKRRYRGFCSYLLSAVIPVLVFWLLACRGHFDPSIPFSYSGDVLGLASLVKTLIQGDWWPFLPIRSASLGAPFGGYHLGDYPTPEQLQYLLLKFLGIFSKNPFWVMNVYFALSFAMVGVAARWAFRRIGVARDVATVAACLYSLAFFHFYRQGHLLLANYAALPLTLPVVLWLWGRKPIFFRKTPAGDWRLDLRSPRAKTSLVVALLLGAWHLYYAFFFAGFLVVAGVSAALSRKSWRHAVSAGILVAAVTGSLVVSLAPNIYARLRYEPNTERVAQRNSWEVEKWALQLTTMTLPMDGHRVPAFRAVKARYHPWPEPVEGWNEYIGTFGVFGMGVLFVAGLAFSRRASSLAKLNLLLLGGILFATRNGFGSHFSALVSPQMRSLNRISIYLALWAFAATALVLTQWLGRGSRSPWLRRGVLLLVLVWGVLDQMPRPFRFTDAARATVESDAEFVHAIEASVPPASAVLQLPYHPFPESGNVEKLGDYSHFRAFMHSDQLRWSYGAMRGRPAAWRIEELSKFPLDFAKLRDAGYAGIYIDRAGFADEAKKLEADLRKRLKRAPLLNRDGTLLFFAL